MMAGSTAFVRRSAVPHVEDQTGPRNRTVGYEEVAPPPPQPGDEERTLIDGLDATVAAEGALAATSAAPAPTSAGDGRRIAGNAAAARTTVLPRVTGDGAQPQLSLDDRPRFEPVRRLGEGGVGEVVLVRDHDIERHVAVKRLRAEHLGTTSLLRFAEEIKIIGQLEHPNIVPIHDVGVDEQGQHYFVMKYVQGETLEAIIARLAEGDPAYTKRFTYEARAQLFLAILQAVRYAHAQGIIHRDLKPSNVMVGPFGEVTVMDWGLAKPIRGAAPAVPDEQRAETAQAAADESEAATTRKKLVRTHHGALLGTPLYMAPEQAAGRVAEMDERSDIFSLIVIFHELMALEHWLADKHTVGEVIAALVSDAEIELPGRELVRRGVPCEYVHFLRHGFARDPAKRYQSIDAMVAKLQAIQNGEFAIECHLSAVKRAGHVALKLVDRHPLAYTIGLVTVGVLAVAGSVTAVAHLFHVL
jgi:serine/threonine-protein kinase